MTRIRMGDLVRLRSGGPQMTVEGVRSGGVVDCVWFDGAQRQTAQFFLATLEPAAPGAQAQQQPQGQGQGQQAQTAEADETEEKAKRPVRKPRKGVH